MKTKITAVLLILMIPIAAAAEDKIARIITELENQLPAVSGKEKIDILSQLASYTYTRAPRKCVDYCRQILQLTNQIHYPNAKADTLIRLSYAYSVLGDWEKSFEYSKQALAIFENQKNKEGIAKALSTIGYFYLRIDYFNMALDYFLRSLKRYEEVEDKHKLYLPYSHIGHLYNELGEPQKALQYFQKALDLFDRSKKDLRIPYCLHSIGLCYQKMADHNKALMYFSQALEIFEDSGDAFWTAAALSNIGKAHLDLNKPDRALTYFSQALHMRENIGDKGGLLYTLHYIGNAYKKMRDYPRALSYYDRAYRIAEKLKDKNNLEEIYKSYADLYAAMEDYKKAFEYHKKYSETRESLFNENKSKQIAELQVQFEAEKKAKEVEILTKDNKIQKITRNMFITAFVLVSVILGLLFKRYLYLFASWKKQKDIGQYRVIETIGSGGMGTVYLAHTIRDKKQLAAVKVLREELMEDESSRQRFKQEGTIIDKLTHPHIVKVFERGEYKGKLYIAMEYLQGKTLAQKIREEGKIDLAEGLDIMKQVTDALAFIHSKNIVHRDLKPANIMLIRQDGRSNGVSLLDFGVALMKFQTRLTQTGMLVGTIHYAAPEQITDNLYSAAGDVYSLGIIFYEMLVGRPPFPQETITALVEKILDEAPKAPDQFHPEIPGELNHLIMQMLSKEPAQRPAAGEVLSALKKMQ